MTCIQDIVKTELVCNLDALSRSMQSELGRKLDTLSQQQQNRTHQFEEELKAEISDMKNSIHTQLESIWNGRKEEEEVARDNILLLKEEVERLGKEKQSEIQYLRERLNWSDQTRQETLKTSATIQSEQAKEIERLKSALQFKSQELENLEVKIQEIATRVPAPEVVFRGQQNKSAAVITNDSEPEQDEAVQDAVSAVESWFTSLTSNPSCVEVGRDMENGLESSISKSRRKRRRRR